MEFWISLYVMMILLSGKFLIFVSIFNNFINIIYLLDNQVIKEGVMFVNFVVFNFVVICIMIYIIMYKL